MAKFVVRIAQTWLDGGTWSYDAICGSFRGSSVKWISWAFFIFGIGCFWVFWWQKAWSHDSPKCHQNRRKFEVFEAVRKILLFSRWKKIAIFQSLYKVQLRNRMLFKLCTKCLQLRVFWHRSWFKCQNLRYQGGWPKLHF